MEPSVTKLMEAEKLVNEQVNNAQQRKAKKLKSIKEESRADLEEFSDLQKKKYEKELKQLEDSMAAQDASAGGNNEEEQARVVKSDYDANKEQVIQMLLDNVMNVNIDIPKVIKGDFDKYMS